MPTMTARSVDLDAWREGRVPPDVEKAIRFIYTHKKCTWREIAQHMEWDHLPRTEWMTKMRRLRRWGVTWNLNVPKSTRIVADVRPFLS